MGLTLKEQILILIEDFGYAFFNPRRMWKDLIFGQASLAGCRTTISRLTKEGYIEKIKRGNKIFFRICEKGREYLSSLPQLDKVTHPKWDGNWRLVSFDIPEEDHKGRDYLRGRLRGLGFGQLHRSVWISPHDLLPQVNKMLELHGFRDFVWTFEGQLSGGEIPKELISAAWPQLEEINQSYRRFVSRWVEELKRVASKSDSKIPGVLYRLAETELASTVFLDPQLPVQFLPSDWSLENAYSVLRKLSKAWGVSNRSRS